MTLNDNVHEGSSIVDTGPETRKLAHKRGVFGTPQKSIALPMGALHIWVLAILAK